MAKPPWARLTKPMSPMVLFIVAVGLFAEHPAGDVDAENHGPPPSGTGAPAVRPSLPADLPCNATVFLARLSASIRSPAGRNLERLAGILHVLDGREHLLEQAAILHDHFGQLLFHDDVGGVGIDLHRTARAHGPPPLDRGERRVGFDL